MSPSSSPAATLSNLPSLSAAVTKTLTPTISVTASLTANGSKSVSTSATSMSTITNSASASPTGRRSLADLASDGSCYQAQSPLRIGYRTSPSSSWTAFPQCVPSFMGYPSAWSRGATSSIGGWCFVSPTAMCTNAPTGCGSSIVFGSCFPSILWNATNFFSSITIKFRSRGINACGDGVMYNFNAFFPNGSALNFKNIYGPPSVVTTGTFTIADILPLTVIELIADPIGGCDCDNQDVSYTIEPP
jgi:hypothetical protein